MFISILTLMFVNESNFLNLDLDLEKSQLNQFIDQKNSQKILTQLLWEQAQLRD
jgi:hypothetical protein